MADFKKIKDIKCDLGTSFTPQSYVNIFGDIVISSGEDSKIYLSLSLIEARALIKDLSLIADDYTNGEYDV